MSQESSQPLRKRRARQGASLNWDDAAIAQAAQVGPQDADAVSAFWDKHAPKQARGLMDATEEEPDERDN